MIFINILNFITPFVFFIVGYSLKKKPYVEIGSNGYSTPRSRASQESWAYAQQHAPDIAILCGKISLGTALLGTIVAVLFQISEQMILYSSMGICFLTMLLFFGIMETRLKIHFE